MWKTNSTVLTMSYTQNRCQFPCNARFSCQILQQKHKSLSFGLSCTKSITIHNSKLDSSSLTVQYITKFNPRIPWPPLHIPTYSPGMLLLQITWQLIIAQTCVWAIRNDLPTCSKGENNFQTEVLKILDWAERCTDCIYGLKWGGVFLIGVHRGATGRILTARARLHGLKLSRGLLNWYRNETTGRIVNRSNTEFAYMV